MNQSITEQQGQIKNAGLPGLCELFSPISKLSYGNFYLLSKNTIYIYIYTVYIYAV